MDQKIISVAIGKGGDGKTTTSTNLAAAFAEEKGAKVCVVDLDDSSNGYATFEDGDLTFDIFTAIPDNINEYTHIILDHSPSHEKYPVSDFVVVPIEAAAKSKKAFLDWQGNLAGKRFIVVCNKYRKGSDDEQYYRRWLVDNYNCLTIPFANLIKRADRAATTVFNMGNRYRASEFRTYYRILRDQINEQY